jgi:ketosteroid isomerase-like protein
MAQQDVDLVRALVLPAEVDLAAVLRDDDSTAALEETSRDLFDPAFRCAMKTVTETWRDGFNGLRQVWLEWLEPWTTYRAVEEDVVDLGGGRVLWLGRDIGTREESGDEVVLISSAIWTVRDGRVSEAVFYASRDEALAVAGL